MNSNSITNCTRYTPDEGCPMHGELCAPEYRNRTAGPDAPQHPGMPSTPGYPTGKPNPRPPATHIDVKVKRHARNAEILTNALVAAAADGRAEALSDGWYRVKIQSPIALRDEVEVRHADQPDNQQLP